MVRRALLATAVVALGVLAAPAAQAADVGSTPSTASTPSSATGSKPYSAPGPPLVDAPSHLRLEAVTGIANVQPRVQSAVNGHPLAKWTATYDAAARQWVARLRDPKSTQDLAVVTIDDTNGKIVKVDLQEDLHPKARLSEKEARGYMERDDKSQDWVQRYRDDGQRVSSTLKYDNDIWTLSWFASGKEVARVRLWDKTAQDPVVVDRPAGGVVDGPRVASGRSASASTTRASSSRCWRCSWSACSTGGGRSRCATSTC